jgi:hypothetical protein
MEKRSPLSVPIPDLTEIVQTALLRSTGALLPVNPCGDGAVAILIGEGDLEDNPQTFRGKALIFGTPPACLLPALGLRNGPGLFLEEGADVCAPAEGDLPFTESAASLAYQAHPLTVDISAALRRRPLTRFDYSDEWNNLGFGRIRTDGGIWSVRGGIIADDARELAGVFMGLRTYCGSYLALYDTPEASFLWCARPAGPVDSTEWTVVERFLSDWRADALPCLPVILQTPAGCNCLVTMRLDCDEDIGSARDVFEWYAGEGIPFSLAVKTDLPVTTIDMVLLHDVVASGGSLLSHTHTHQPNWGATPEEALAEAEASRRWFAQQLPTAHLVDLAVSPFHTNPPYAVQALVHAGFTGFVSGIIHNDPEYLLGRAGLVPFAAGRMVGISQQSMLHGDCYRRQQGSVAVHIAAFEAQYAARGIFGYLDHPFSERYQYDWENAGQRLRAHQRLIAAIRRHPGVWFWSQQQCFDFVKALYAVRLRISSEGKVMNTAALERSDMAYRYRGKEYTVSKER